MPTILPTSNAKSSAPFKSLWALLYSSLETLADTNFETANGKDTAYAGAYNGIYFVSAVITDIPNDANVTFNVKTIENGITATEGATVILNSGNAVA